MKRIVCFSLLSFLWSQQIVAQTSCVSIVPNENDYIVSAELLRASIKCLEDKIPKHKASKASYTTAFRYNKNTYIQPLVDQKFLFIRQVNSSKDIYQYNITFYNNEGTIVKQLVRDFKNNKKIIVDLIKEKVRNADFAVIKVIKKDKLDNPISIVFAGS